MDRKAALAVNDDAPIEKKKGTCGCPWETASIIKFTLLLIVLFGGGFCLVYFHKNIAAFLGQGGPLQDFVKKAGVWGYFIYAFIYMACTVLFIPGSALTLGAGIVFHTAKWTSLLVAVAVVFVGATAGASLAFILGRFVFRSYFEQQIVNYPTFAAVEKAIGEQGFYITLLLRLSPVIPFNFLNYALGITSVTFMAYFVASVGMLPGTLLYVYIGWVAAEAATANGQLSPKAKLAKNSFLIVGSIATVAAVVLISVVSKRAISKAIAEADEKNSEATGLLNNDNDEDSTGKKKVVIIA